ncbi:MAG: hypothetical protein M9894_25655 [Planctomycetes bacterium]|nr:hypothetical protein [Planctomycetota bacterium]
MSKTLQAGPVRATVSGDAFGGTFSVKVELVGAAPLAFSCAGTSVPLGLPGASVTVSGKLQPVGQTHTVHLPQPGPPVPYLKPSVQSPTWGWYESYQGTYVDPVSYWGRFAAGQTGPGEWKTTWVSSPPHWKSTWKQDTWKVAPTTAVTAWVPGFSPKVDALQVAVSSTSGSPDLDAFCRKLLQAFGEDPAALVARLAELGHEAWQQVAASVEAVWEQFVTGFDLKWDLSQYLPAGCDLRQLLRNAAFGALNALRTKLEQLLRDTLGQVLAHLQDYCKRLWEVPALRDGAGPLLLAAAALLLVFILGPAAVLLVLVGVCVLMVMQQPAKSSQWLQLLEKLLAHAIELGQGVAGLVREGLAQLLVALAGSAERWAQVRAHVGAMLERLAAALRQKASFDLAAWLKALAQQVAQAVRQAGLLQGLTPLAPPGAGAVGPQGPQPGKGAKLTGQQAPAPSAQQGGGAAGGQPAGQQAAGGMQLSAASLAAQPASPGQASGGQASGGQQQAGGSAAAGGMQLSATSLAAQPLAGQQADGKGKAAGSVVGLASGATLAAALGGAHGKDDGRFTSPLALEVASLQLPADAAAALELAEVSPAGQLCGELVVVLSQPMQDPWAFAGWLLDCFVGVFRQAGADLGHLLKPLFLAARQVGPISAEQFFDLVQPLPEQALRAVAEWVYAAWEWVKTAIIQAAWDAILEWLAMLLGLVSAAQEALLAELAALRELLQWVGTLPRTLLEPADLFDVKGYLDDVLAALRRKDGLTGWLAERSQATSTSMVELVKRLVQENPLTRTVEQLGEHVRGVLELAGPVGQADPVAQLRELQRRAEAVAAQLERTWALCADAAASAGPFVIEAKVEGVVTDPLQVDAGAVVQAGSDLVGTIASGEAVSASGLGLGASLLSLRARDALLELPPPDGVRRVWPADLGDGTRHARELPLPFPLPWEGGVALAYQPVLYVVDMRYHMAYGPSFSLRLLDADGAGRVGGGAGGPAQRIEAQLGKPPEEQDLSLDVDRDGRLTQADLDLARDQQRYYVNGVMWRRVTAPAGFFASLSPWDWVFAAVLPLGQEPEGAPPLRFTLDEGVRGKFERLGVLSVISGQVTVPALNYRIRYQYEGRYYLDLFTAFDLRHYVDPPGHPAKGPPLPMAFAPGTRHDLIVRGGDTGRDWQAHLTSEPLNPMLRMWTLKATVFLKGLLSYAGVAQYSQTLAGVQGEADVKITVIYKTKTPLIAVMSQWHQRFTHLAHNPPQLPKELPVPWGMIKAILEYSHLPQLSRALIGVTGPFMDLCFEWVDEKKHLRAAIGYMRQSVLSRWTPAPSWHELLVEVSRWKAQEVGGAAWRDAIAAGVAEARDLLAASAGVEPCDEDPVYAPDFVADVARRHVLAQFEALAPGGMPAPVGPPPPEHSPPPADGAEHSPPPPDPAVQAALASLALAEQKLDEAFGDRGRFAAGPDQLVQRLALLAPPEPGDEADRAWLLVEALEGGRDLEGRPATLQEPVLPAEAPQGTRVTIPGCGGYRLRRPYMVAFPLQRKDVDAAKAEKGEVLADELIWVRGNPFYKPLYHALVEVGTEMQLYTVPRRATRYLVHVVGLGEPVVVESSVALEDAGGNVWLWVRTRAFRYGWLCVDKTAWDAVFKRPEGAAAGLAQQVACSLVDPDKVELAYEVAEAMGVHRRPIKRLEPSPRETLDDTRYAPLMRRLLARQAGQAATGDDEMPLDLLSASMAAAFDADDDEARAVDLWYAVLQEMNIRILGFPAADKAAEDGLQAEELARLGEVFAALSPRAREQLWSATTSWLRTFCYLPFIGVHIIEEIVHPIIAGDWELALEKAQHALREMADFSPMELLQAVQSSLPYLLEAVKQVIEIGQKCVRAYKALDKAADAASGKKTEAEGEGELGGVKGKGWADWSTGSGKAEAHGTLDVVKSKGEDPGAPAWDDLGMMMLRLFVDDQAAPGRPAPKKGDPKHDWGIKFDAKASVKNLWGPDKPPAEGATELTFRIGYPQVDKVTITAFDGEKQGPGDQVWLEVYRWKVVGPAIQGAATDVDGDRVPPGVLSAVEWSYAVGPTPPDGAAFKPLRTEGGVAGLFADDGVERPRARGARVKFQVPREVTEEKVWFKAAVDQAKVQTYVDARGFGDFKPVGGQRPGLAGYFPWDFVDFTFKAGAGARYDVLVGGATVLSVPLEEGDHGQGGFWLGAPLQDGSTLTPARSPVKVVFTNAQGFADAPVDQPGAPTSKKGLDGKGLETEGEVALDFGNDSLLITWQTEAKGGGGAGDEAGTGASGGATTGPRFSMPTVELPMDMLMSEQSLAILVRFFCRFFYHETEALYQAVKWLEKEKVDPEDTAACAQAGLGFGFWTLVYSGFALKEAIFDLVHDHAQWVARLLQGVRFIGKFDWSGKLGLTALGKGEATAEVHGVLELPLGTVLWPVIDVLLQADTTARTGPTLKDLIEPCLKATLEDVFTVKVGAAPVLVEVESRGRLAEGTVHIPPDSPLIADLEGYVAGIARAAEQWKARSQDPAAPKVEDAHVALKLLRMTFDMLYHETQAILVDRSPEKAWKAASPVVIELMNRFTEGLAPPKDVPPLDEVRPEVQALVGHIDALALRGVAFEPGQVVIVEGTVATGRSKLWLYLEPEERQALAARWLPPEPPQELYETVTWAVPLPQAPLAVGWHTFDDPGAGKTFTGVVAGFAAAGAAQSFAGARPAAWVDAGLAGVTWSRSQGDQELHWAWVETKLVPALDAQQRDLPALEQAGAKLLLTFEHEPVGAVATSTAPVLAQAQVHARRPISRVVLATDATVDEQRLLVNAVQRHQPAAPPTPFTQEPPPGGAPDVWVGDPRKPRDASHRMRPVWLEWGATGGRPAPKGRREAPEPGLQAPKPGLQAPKPGLQAPKPGLQAPKPGLQAPKPGPQAPKPGLQAPKPGLPAPKLGLQAPKPGLQAPKPGLEGPTPAGPPGGGK